MATALRTAKVFLYFLWRDFYVYKSRVLNYCINNCFIYPILYSVFFGYIQPNVYFGVGSEAKATALFIGHILIIIFVFANTLNSTLLFDLENVRFTDYQITLLPPRIFLLERIFFASLFTFIIAIPYFPVAKLLLGHRFVVSNANWPLTYLILYLSALCCSAYTMFAACWIENSRKLRTFWMRFNFPLLTFGGLFVPWFVSKQLSSTLGYAMLFNPLLYISEGLRSSILGSPEYIAAPLCILALLIFTTIFTLLSWHYFKKKVDHI
jgi:ABC-2 type transport system permease protein